jgi:hypothetical protein
MAVRSQPRQIVCKTLSQKTLHKNRAGRMAQGEGPEFKYQYRNKTKQKIKNQRINNPVKKWANE